MFKNFLATIMFAISINSAFAFTNYEFRNEVKVGKSPSKIFSFDDKGFFVVCLGQDIDYDFEFDEGEELPSLWYVSYNNNDNSYSSEMKYSFEDFTNYPYTTVRFGLDKEGKALYVPLRKGVISISLDDFTILDPAVINISAYGLEYVAGHLLVSYNDENSNGKLTVVNLANNQVLQTLNIGINLQETIYFPSSKGISIAALSVGPFGESNSKVFYGAINHKFDFALSDSVLLGNTGNHLQFANGKIYATVNMSHLIKEIDPVTHAVRTFHTGTSGYNGPRESLVVGDKLFVTTYAEDIRIFDIESGFLESIIDSKNNFHLEGLEVINENTIAVSGIYTDTYSASNTVEIFTKSETKYPMTSYNVGGYPVWIENIDGVVNVICKGVDTNNNGVFDKDEEKGSWWIIKNNIPEKKLDFGVPFYDFPLYDKQNKLIYIPHINSIKSYSTESFNINDDAVASVNASHLEIAGGHLLFAKTNQSAPDSIIVLNLSNGKILQKLPAGTDIYSLKYYPDPNGIGLAFTAAFEETEEFKLMYGPINHMVDFKLDNQFLLDGYAQLIYKDSTLITLSGRSGVSNLINVYTDELSSFNFGVQNYYATSITKDEDNLFVSTFLGDIRVLNINRNELEEIIPIENPAFSINNIGNDELNIAVCSPYYSDATINNKVFIMKPTLVSLEDKITYENVKVFPNPAQDYIQLDLNNLNYNSINIKIYDNKGNIVKEVNNQLTDRINIKALNSGSYIINVIMDGNIYNLPLSIVR